MLLSTCANHGRKSSDPDAFQDRYTGRHKSLAPRKLGTTVVGGFEDVVLQELSDNFHSLDALQSH